MTNPVFNAADGRGERLAMFPIKTPPGANPDRECLEVILHDQDHVTSGYFYVDELRAYLHRDKTKLEQLQGRSLSPDLIFPQ